MVFFVYIGGGPRALAFSFMVFFLSMLLQRLSYDTIDESMSPDMGSMGSMGSMGGMGFFEDESMSSFYARESRERRTSERRHRRPGRRVQVQNSFWNTLLSYICVVTLVVVLLFMAVLLLFRCRPHLRQRPAVRRVENLIFRWTNRMEEWMQELRAEPKTGRTRTGEH